MNRLITILVIIAIFLSFGVGWYVRGLQEPKEITVKKPVQNKIKREVKKMSRPEMEQELTNFYQDDYNITWKRLNDRNYEINVDLNGRILKQKLEVPVYEDDNIRFTVGVAVGAGLTALAIGTTLYLARR